MVMMVNLPISANAPSQAKTLVDLLYERAQHQPDQIAYILLQDGEIETSRLTYQDLAQQVYTIAAHLQAVCSPGDRALLLYEPGLDFITGFFACLCAGIVAVPTYLPKRHQKLSRLQGILQDAAPTAVLTTTSVCQLIEQGGVAASPLQPIHWIFNDRLTASSNDFLPIEIRPDTLAFLQYTSGSTGVPKGVMISHKNLIHNCAAIQQCLEIIPKTPGICWLPPYHDMGLVGGVLQSVAVGTPVVIMPPIAFLQNPIRWLKAISTYQATVSAAPNFAYDLCVRKVKPEQLPDLDLSSWEIAFSGAEPVRAETIESFTQTFSACGFRPGSFHPAYGMAETTLLISSVRKAEVPTIKVVAAQALEQHQIVDDAIFTEAQLSRRLVSCGHPWLDQQVAIVHPDSHTQCPIGCVGEIWVASDSVAQGYWNQVEETQQTFHAYLADTGAGPFLRTGDLGFWLDGSLFVTGRLKDLLIIRGRNHYPQDIEQTVEACHPALNPHSSAVFSMEIDGGDRVIVACEVKRTFLRRLDVEGVVTAVRQAVLQDHELQVYRVLLLKPGSLPKTPSGKVQRFACRADFLAGNLSLIALGSPTNNGRQTVAKTPWLQTWIAEWIAQTLHIPVTSIDHHTLFTNYGLDSLQVARLIQDLETTSGYSLNFSTLLAFPTIATLANHVTAELAQNGKTSAYLKQPLTEIPVTSYRFEDFPEYKQLQQRLDTVQTLGVANPYFQVHEALPNDRTSIQGRTLINYSTYNYLGLSGDPTVSAAAKAAIDRYGTSVAASRLVSGERPLHRELEQELAMFLGVEDCIVYVSGHATNVTTIGHLLNAEDLILYDALSHNSILQGCALSGAKAVPFPHNDWQALDRLLHEQRHHYRRTLIVIEGIYSMDGDIPNLPEFIALKQRYKALLMVDEAHSIGTLGKQGRGIGELFGSDRTDVDLWMGTLSKALASCGGYIAGSKALITYLKYTAPGFVYSVGLSPADTAAALAALRLLQAEPLRVQTLHQRSQYFLNLAQAQKWNTGTSQNSPIIPIVLGNSVTCIQVAQLLFQAGINVQPMIYPAVANQAARLRFFMSCLHTETQIDITIAALATALTQVALRSKDDEDV
ncbi:MAG: aminotransferase class I/II-fold pyridoxal phosphate-dependent enzyme [Pantanalinema sp. GBBB05]|nr:aminotransferase class I/II-fold pyridoxal phosphate-dependent enzyme [Pantanalinema sp. GBBB05]